MQAATATSDSDDVEVEPYLNLPAAARLREGESIDAFRQRTIFRHDLHFLPPSCFACDDPSSSESDDEMAQAPRAPPPLLVDTDRTPSLQERMLGRAITGEIPSSKRGKYARPARTKPYAQVAYEHKEEVESFSIGRPCLSSCKYDRNCGLAFLPANLIRAHERIYGDKCRMEMKADGTPLYSCALTLREVQERREDLVMSCITFDTQGKRVERFTVDNIGPVCPEYCRRAHGIPEGSWLPLLADARANKLQAAREWELAAPELHDCDLKDLHTSTSREDTIEWWVIWLTLEDQCPNEASIVHRVVRDWHSNMLATRLSQTFTDRHLNLVTAGRLGRGAQTRICS